MNKFVKCTGAHGADVWFNVSRVSAIVATANGTCSVYTAGDAEPFKIAESAEELIRKFSI